MSKLLPEWIQDAKQRGSALIALEDRKQYETQGSILWHEHGLDLILKIENQAEWTERLRKQLVHVAEENADMRRHINHGVQLQKNRNVEVLAVLGDSPTDPEEHYVHPVTLATRARDLEAENLRLRRHIMTARDLLETHPMPSDAYRVLSEAINAEGGDDA